MIDVAPLPARSRMTLNRHRAARLLCCTRQSVGPSVVVEYSPMKRRDLQTGGPFGNALRRYRLEGEH
jgi:hypothetical protein